MTHPSEQTLSDQVLQWVVDSVNSSAIVESVDRLHGGMSSIVHSVSLRSGDLVNDYVVRQFNNKDWLSTERDLVAHEGANLRLASKVALPTPELIAFDEMGHRCGMPTVLMTKLEGSVILAPDDMSVWLDGLAESLVAIHRVAADDHPWIYRTYIDIDALDTPMWSYVPQLWSQAIDIARGPIPQTKPCFIHRDYHPTNVLWHRGRVSGVVDWVNACRGPAGIDLAHCRWNLALLFDVTTADLFLSKYESYAGSTFRYDPYWDLLSMMDTLFGPPQVYPGWTALGVTGLTDEMMSQRSDAYLLSILKRYN
ncbi:MAG: aminoglycoside phosphotransferase family protein [Paenibacillaceae bacterium]